jgi:WD40 repeat protein
MLCEFPSPFRKHVAITLYFLLLLVLLVGCWDLISIFPRVRWQTLKEFYLVGFAADSSLLIVHDGNPASPYRLWNPYTGNPQSADAIEQISTAPELTHVKSPDGNLLLVVQPDGAELRDAHTFEKRGVLHKEGDYSPYIRHITTFEPRLPQFTFSPNSKLVLSTGLVNGKAAATLPPVFDKIVTWLARPDYYDMVSFAGPSANSVARLYDTETATEVIAFHDCSQAFFSPDSRLIATAHDDGTICIWDAPPKRSVTLLLGLLSLWLAEVSANMILTRRVA